MEQAYAVIDMKAFYAFVECVERNLDPFKTPLVVCDTSRGEGTIVLSVSPYLKKLGIPSRCRKRELPHLVNMIFATPRMSLYVKKSAQIVSIVLNYVGEDDIHVYSIDELFVNLGPYLKMYNCSSKELVNKIQKDIYKQTKLVATSGIGDNMLLAKLALDLDGKNTPPYIALWHQSDVKTKLWPITPLSKMWGISKGYESKLNALGIITIGDLANTPKEILIEKFGIIGEQLWEHANGIDNTNIREKYIPEETSLSLGQEMHENYSPEETKLLILEMNDDLSTRLRSHHEMTQEIGLTIKFDYELGGGFSHHTKLDYPTDDSETILKAIYAIFDKYSQNHYARGIYIVYSKLTHETFSRLSIFEDPKTSLERKALDKVKDEIKNRFGQNSILRGSSLLKKSTAKERHNQIGGHRK